MRRTPSWKIVPAAIMLAFPGVALAGDQLSIAPAPDWVRPVAYKDSPATDTQAAVQVLGSDMQVRFVGGEAQRFAHVAFRILNPSGLSSGNLSLSWSPDQGGLTVHKVLIHRGNQLIDVLAGGQTFTVLRREQNLEMATLDGVLTASLQPEGLQVGDIVEYMYTVTAHDPVMRGHIEFGSPGWNSLPIGRAHLKVIWPGSIPMRVRTDGPLPQVMPVQAGGDKVAEITIDDLDPGLPPRHAPARYRLGRVVEMTDFASWGDISRLMAPLYVTASAIPASGPLHDELEKIRNSSPDFRARAEAALALVQDRVRYVALEMGVGGYVPSDAAITWSRRFGDCKAKTALLLGLLHGLGIAAEPVAVNVVAGDGMDQRLPLVAMFNHVLVRATIGDTTFWLDGTRASHHRLRSEDVPLFDWGLPLVASATGLVRMMPPPPSVPFEAMSVHIDASAGVQAPAPTEAEIVLTGDSAAGTNDSLAAMTADARREALERLWKTRLGQIEVKTSSTRYDTDAEALHIVMSGTLKMEWPHGEYHVEPANFSFANVDLSRAAGTPTDIPYAVTYPLYNRTTETIVLPKSEGSFHIGTAMEVDETVAGFALHRHADLRGGVFTIESSMRSMALEFPARDATTAQARLRALAQQQPLLHMPLAYRSTSNEIAAARADEPTTSEAYVNRAIVYMRQAMDGAARNDLDRAIALDANNPYAWADRAAVKGKARDFDGARADLAKAEAINPNIGVIYKVKGELAQETRDWPGALRAYQQALVLEPEDDTTLARLGAINAQLGNYAQALEYTGKLVRGKSNDRAVLLLHAGMLEKLGRNAELIQILDRMMRTEPNNTMFLRSRAGAYMRMGRRDLAMKDIMTLARLGGKGKAAKAPEMIAPPIEVTAPSRR